MLALTQEGVGEEVTGGVLLASGVRRCVAGGVRIGAVAVTLDAPDRKVGDGLIGTEVALDRAQPAIMHSVPTTQQTMALFGILMAGPSRYGPQTQY